MSSPDATCWLVGWMNPAAVPWARLVALVVYPLAFTEVSIAAIWGALDRQRRLLRMACVWLVILIWSVMLDAVHLQSTGWGNYVYGTSPACAWWVSVFVTHTAILALAVAVTRKDGLQIAVPLPGRQFSISTLLWITVVLAICFSSGKYLLMWALWYLFSLGPLLLSAGGLAGIGFCVMRAAVPPSRQSATTAARTVGVVAGAACLTLGLRWGLSGRPGLDYLLPRYPLLASDYLILAGLYAALLYTSLRLARAAGFRFLARL